MDLSPSDADIRAVLVKRLRSDDRNVAVIEELGLRRGNVRVDVAAVTDSTIHGYEIKSDRDSLRRLARQAKVYGAVFDHVTIVVGAKHVDKATAAVPDWWGVLVVSMAGDVLTVRPLREARPNPGRDPRAIVELLWLDDARAFLAARARLRGYGSRPRREVWDCICAVSTLDEIAAAVRRQLVARRGQPDLGVRGSA